MEDKKYIAFAYYKDNKLMGWRSDTFNTLTKYHPKIYTYSREQVDIVLNNVKNGCNNIGKHFMKKLSEITNVASSASGEMIEMPGLVSHVSKTEQQFKDWGEFDVYVHEFINPEEWYSLEEGDEWKKEQILNNLGEPLEKHRFKIMDYAN